MGFSVLGQIKKFSRYLHGLAVCALLSGIIFTSYAHAQDDSAAPAAKGAPAASAKVSAKDADKRKTSIDFEDELIQGEVKKPELFYLLQKKQFNFKRLIKLREDFLPEMRRTSQDIRRSGSGN